MATCADRPLAADLAAAVASGATVPDVLAPGLQVVMCGINPGRWSGAVGHHFAHPQNRFWKALHLAGFTPEVLTPDSERRLLEWGVGITNLVDRTTASAADLTAAELREGSARLEAKVRRLHPRSICFLGLGAYRSAFRRPRAALGLQDEQVGGAAVWLVANPSGLQARYGLDEVAAQLAALRAWLAGPGARNADPAPGTVSGQLSQTEV